VPTVADIEAYLHQFAPPERAAEWDNVGLILGERACPVSRILTCLTVTPEVVDEAIATGVQLIVTHHPVLFRPVKKLDDSTPEGRMVLALVKNGVAVYSPHTAFDNCRGGINDLLAERFGLQNVRALRPSDNETWGEGRVGGLPKPVLLGEWAAQARLILRSGPVQVVGDPEKPISKIAIACGAAGEFLEDALEYQADAFLTGEMRFHDYLAASCRGLALVLPGHFATERLGALAMAETLAREWPQIEVAASQSEGDPVGWV
jgi:dinuclear metal center YbgI/SA1388 family protein